MFAPSKPCTRLLGKLPPRRQNGAALVTGLILLVLITLLSVTAMRVASLEERMSSHSSDRALAFQAAEAALRQGEQYLNNAVLGNFNHKLPDSSGLYLERLPGFADTNAADGINDSCPSNGSLCKPWWEVLTWTNADSAQASGMTNVAAQPRYIIENVTGPVTCYKSGNCSTSLAPQGGSLKQGAIPDTGLYRITARGVGLQVDGNGNPATVVFLQSIYQR